VELRFSTADNVTEHAIGDLPDLLTRPDEMAWLDIPNWDEHAEQLCEGCFTWWRQTGEWPRAEVPHN
jgi:hypothetical protein